MPPSQQAVNLAFRVQEDARAQKLGRGRLVLTQGGHLTVQASAPHLPRPASQAHVKIEQFFILPGSALDKR